ncbi:MAG: hypothetical protein ACRCVS_01000 [Fusobacteriaceae bacterium]
MNELEMKIVLTISKIGPTFVSKLANRILEKQTDVKESVKILVAEKILVRVENIMVNYKTKESNVVIKHRNHTYFELTKLGERKAKEIILDDDKKVQVREAFKTYNKALQNSLDNCNLSDEDKTNTIYCVIDFPYSQELSVKNILGENFNKLSKEYHLTITLRGDISKEEKDSLLLLDNIVVI